MVGCINFEKGHRITKGNRDGMSRPSKFPTIKLRVDLDKYFVRNYVDLVKKHVCKDASNIATSPGYTGSDWKKDTLKQYVELTISNKNWCTRLKYCLPISNKDEFLEWLSVSL